MLIGCQEEAHWILRDLRRLRGNCLAWRRAVLLVVDAIPRAKGCALSHCSSVAEEEPAAALALRRLSELQQVPEHEDNGEWRFRRRAFERARDRALVAIAMHIKPAMLMRKSASREQACVPAGYPREEVSLSRRR